LVVVMVMVSWDFCSCRQVYEPVAPSS
jgi:hypothetical protein